MPSSKISLEDNSRQYEECLSQIVSRRNSELFNNAENRRASLNERMIEESVLEAF